MLGINLKKLSHRLARVDRHLLATLAVRIGKASLSDLVAQAKRKTDGPVYPVLRKSVEDQRLALAEKWAGDLGLDPDYAATVIFGAISESCREQAMYMHQHLNDVNLDEDDPEAVWQFQRSELLRLTEAVAEKYDQMNADFFGTTLYLKFEQGEIARTIDGLDDLGLALDLGCATGTKALMLGRHFQQVIGYDISPKMIQRAVNKSNHSGNVSFKVADLEDGIPQADSSVSLALMNLGTASDIRQIDQLLVEIKRVLKPSGKFILSFYNADSLLSQLGFLPWPASLAAMVDSDKRCLEVHFEKKVFLIHARPYSVKEVEKLLKRHGLATEKTLTHPTVSAILPEGILFTEEFNAYGKIIKGSRCRSAKTKKTYNAKVKKSLDKLDKELATSSLNLGAYIIVVGGKKQ